MKNPHPTHCPKCGHDLSEPLVPRDLFGIAGVQPPTTPEATPAVVGGMQLARFEAFWSEYPRKVGKKAAEKAFLKLKLNGDQMERLLAALAVQKASDQWNRQGVQYVPHPATWLNQRRWEDDPAAYGRAGTPGQPGRVGLAPGQKLSQDDSHLTDAKGVDEA